MAFTQWFSCSASLFLDNLMVFSWNPKGSWRILLRMPFIESLNDEKWRTCWSTSVGLTQHSPVTLTSLKPLRMSTQLMDQISWTIWDPHYSNTAIDLVVIVLHFLDIQPHLLKRYDMKSSTHTPQNISKLPQHTPNISECTGISNVAVYWFYILYTSSHRLMSFGIQMDQQKSYKVVPKSSYRWHINGVI